MDRKVSKKAGRAVYRKRQHIIEPVFGQIKDARGARRFMRRGKAAAASEWKLLMGTHNLLKLYRQTLTDPSAWPRGAPKRGPSNLRAPGVTSPRPTVLLDTRPSTRSTADTDHLRQAKHEALSATRSR